MTYSREHVGNQRTSLVGNQINDDLLLLRITVAFLCVRNKRLAIGAHVVRRRCVGDGIVRVTFHQFGQFVEQLARMRFH